MIFLVLAIRFIYTQLAQSYRLELAKRQAASCAIDNAETQPLASPFVGAVAAHFAVKAECMEAAAAAEAGMDEPDESIRKSLQSQFNASCGLAGSGQHIWPDNQLGLETEVLPSEMVEAVKACEPGPLESLEEDGPGPSESLDADQKPDLSDGKSGAAAVAENADEDCMTAPAPSGVNVNDLDRQQLPVEQLGPKSDDVEPLVSAVPEPGVPGHQQVISSEIAEVKADKEVGDEVGKPLGASETSADDQAIEEVAQPLEDPELAAAADDTPELVSQGDASEAGKPLLKGQIVEGEDGKEAEVKEPAGTDFVEAMIDAGHEEPGEDESEEPPMVTRKRQWELKPAPKKRGRQPKAAAAKPKAAPKVRGRKPAVCITIDDIVQPGDWKDNFEPAEKQAKYAKVAKTKASCLAAQAEKVKLDKKQKKRKLHQPAEDSELPSAASSSSKVKSEEDKIVWHPVSKQYAPKVALILNPKPSPVPLQDEAVDPKVEAPAEPEAIEANEKDEKPDAKKLKAEAASDAAEPATSEKSSEQKLRSFARRVCPKTCPARARWIAVRQAYMSEIMDLLDELGFSKHSLEASDMRMTYHIGFLQEMLKIHKHGKPKVSFYFKNKLQSHPESSVVSLPSRLNGGIIVQLHSRRMTPLKL